MIPEFSTRSADTARRDSVCGGCYFVLPGGLRRRAAWWAREDRRGGESARRTPWSPSTRSWTPPRPSAPRPSRSWTRGDDDPPGAEFRGDYKPPGGKRLDAGDYLLDGPGCATRWAWATRRGGWSSTSRGAGCRGRSLPRKLDDEERAARARMVVPADACPGNRQRRDDAPREPTRRRKSVFITTESRTVVYHIHGRRDARPTTSAFDETLFTFDGTLRPRRGCRFRRRPRGRIGRTVAPPP